MTVQVERRVRVELVEQRLVPDAPDEPDVAAPCQRADGRAVAAACGALTDDHQRQASSAPDVSLDDEVDVVLRLHPGHDEVVAAGLEPELWEPIAARSSTDGRAVGDERGVDPVALAVVVADAPGRRR